jgi:hypothetical protein
VDVKDTEVKVHYEGWESRWDRWLPKTSDQLAKLGTKVSLCMHKYTFRRMYMSLECVRTYYFSMHAHI